MVYFFMFKSMMINTDFEFKPWQSVGVFHFNDNIEHYQHILSDWIFETQDKYGKEHYHTHNHRMIISVYQHKIISIFCYETLYYQGVNLIGLTIDEFMNITQANFVGEPEVIDFEDDSYPQTIYHFDMIGAMVWTKQHHIVTIIVAGRESYSNESCDDIFLCS